MFSPSSPATTALPFAGGGFPEPTRENLLARQQMATENAIADSQAAQQAIRAKSAQQFALGQQTIPAAREPKFYNVQPPPKQEFINPLKAFANPLVLAVTLGSLAVRRGGGLAAMKAATEAINGFHKGDQEAMKNNMDNWQAATDAVIKQNNIELSRYNAALNTTKHNVGERAAKMEAIAASIGDEVKLAAMRSGDWDRVISLTDQQRQYTEQMEQLKLRYGTGAITDGDVQSAAQRLAAGEDENTVLKSYNTSGPVGAENKNRITRAAEDLYRQKWGDNWPDELNRQRARVKAYAPAERSLAVRAKNTEFINNNLNRQILRVIQSSKQVQRGNWVPFNDLVQMAEESISDPALRQFRTDLLELGNWWGRAMNPTGQLRVDDRNHALRELGSGTGEEALLAGIGRINEMVKSEREIAERMMKGQDVPLVDIQEEIERAKAGGTTGAGGAPHGATNIRVE